MPSISEPATPHHHEKVMISKWAASSNDICSSDESEDEGNPLKLARFKALRVKREAIRKFLKAHKDENLVSYIDDLRTFACTPGGLVDDELRAVIWPILASKMVQSEDDLDELDALSCDSDFESALSEFSEKTSESEDDTSIDMLKLHPEWNQVALDVHRTLARFPPNISDCHRTTLQEELVPLIVRVLRRNPKFRYYQGFHDVCLTITLVCGVESAYRICCELTSTASFKAYLIKTLEQSVLKELDLMYVILSKVEPELEKIMRNVQLGSLFALSWPLTWFSHSLQHYQQIVRFFDVFLSTHPLQPVYTSAAIVIFRRASILACEREMPFIHQLLSNMPHELPIDAILSDSRYLAKLMPPCLLRKKYLEEYREKVAHPPRVPLSSAIPRYTLQLMFVAGAASAAAGYYLLSKYSI